MKHASLFSGIGGFDLAAEWAGWTNVFNCEIDKFCQKVLRYHFPNAIQYEDIKSTDFAIHREGVDVLTGGFPCQPFSLAGKRRGASDNRYLWPEMLRAIREIRPRWVVGENVLGIVSWSEGMVLEQVCADLEGEGYEVQPFLIPACAVDAPHRRDRVWFVAHRRDAENPISNGLERKPCSCEANPGEWKQRMSCAGDSQWVREKTRPFASDGCNARVEVLQREGARMRNELSRIECTVPMWECFPTQSPVCGRDDGVSARLDGITFPRWRRESIKAYGNAVVPQVVLQIFETIKEYENEIQTEIPDTRKD